MELEEGWEIISKEISKLINILEGVPDESPRYVTVYTAIYTLCTKKPILEKFYDDYKELYKRYEGVYNEYLSCKVLPSILEKEHDDVSMLHELVKRWENHKVMVTKLARYFSYMDRHHISVEEKLPTMKDVGFGCFRKIVYEKVKVKAKDAVIALVNRESEGNQIDRSLVKDVVEIFVQVGNDQLDYYVNGFENACRLLYWGRY